MWQDYPGVAAAVTGIVTMATQRMRRWQKLMIVALTIIAIGATGFAQWWTLHERKVEEVRRVEVREQLGKFIEEGQSLQFAIASKINEPVPEERVRDVGETNRGVSANWGIHSSFDLDRMPD